MLKKLKGYMMPIAMTLGITLHKYVEVFYFLIPYFIFIMLLLAYVKLSWNQIKFTKMHLFLILIQIVGGIVVYYMLLPFNATLAQGAMVCLFAPTASAAPVIAAMLKGDVACLAGYSLVSNVTVAIMAPLFFSFIGYNDLPFFASVFEIAKRMSVLLVVPLVLGMLLNRYTPKISGYMKKHTGISLYLWSIALTVVSGKITMFILEQGKENYTVEILIALAASILCVLQFIAGRRIGRKYGDTVAGGQGLGQKNTVLTIWMTQLYLNPIASIGPGSYVLWQNIVNSYQIWRARKDL